MRAKTARAAACILGLAALLPAAARAQGAVPLALRVFPRGAAVSVDGAPVQGRADAQGFRVLRLPSGSHLVRLEGDGCISREIPVQLAAPLVLELKLEREGSRFVRLGGAATGRQPKSLAYTPDGRHILCALLEGPGVEVFDADSLHRRGVLSPPAPWPAQVGFVETAILPGRDELWVSQMTTGQLHVFRLSDFSYLASFPSGGTWSKVIAASPDEATVFVSNWESRDVSLIDAAARTLAGRIAVGGVPRGMAVTADGLWLYVCLFDRGVVQKVDVSKRAVVKSLSFGEGALRHAVLHPSRGELYVSDMLKGRILVVDTARETLLAEVRVDRNLNTIALSPDGRFLFVSSRGPNNPEDYTKKGPAFGTVSSIDVEQRKVVDWTWGKNQPTGLAVSPDGRSIAFSNFLDDEIEVYGFSGEAPR